MLSGPKSAVGPKCSFKMLKLKLKQEYKLFLNIREPIHSSLIQSVYKMTATLNFY